MRSVGVRDSEGERERMFTFGKRTRRMSRVGQRKKQGEE